MKYTLVNEAFRFSTEKCSGSQLLPREAWVVVAVLVGVVVAAAAAAEHSPQALPLQCKADRWTRVQQARRRALLMRALAGNGHAACPPLRATAEQQW